MGAAPVGTITKLLYESAHLSVDHFVSSGHVGASWQYAEHFHEAIQITVLSREAHFKRIGSRVPDPGGANKFLVQRSV